MEGQRGSIAMSPIETATSSFHQQSNVCTMAVEEGHIVNLDGQVSTAGARYQAIASETDGNKRITSGVGRNSLFTVDKEDDPDNGSEIKLHTGGRDRGSIVSGATSQADSVAKLPWYKGITFKDIRDITPTLLILLGGLLIMIFVIPYAFSSVIKQLQNEGKHEMSGNENSTDVPTTESSTSVFREN